MAKSIYVAPLRGVTMPAAMLGEEKDRLVGVDEVVKVPEHYGRHLIDDRFAVESGKPEVKPADDKSQKPADGGQGGSGSGAPQT